MKKWKSKKELNRELDFLNEQLERLNFNLVKERQEKEIIKTRKELNLQEINAVISFERRDNIPVDYLKIKIIDNITNQLVDNELVNFEIYTNYEQCKDEIKGTLRVWVPK